ncbi:FimV/HubP family polar landmark protein [Pseudomonas sp.]|uniref:FimV/HubP family polar landmark protein n=1 Tax=Pseudomonas sp. TaxID=306 RepID=UPI003C714EC7
MARVRQLLIGLASSSALYSSLVPALGLGEITLHSALSQPLDAEIELFDVGDLTAEDMRVRLAPADVFSRSGVDRLYFFSDLRFTPLLRGGKSVIRVVSSQPVREPYLNFIVEVVRPNGQLYREYTVLLDPPGSSAYRSLAAAPEPLPAAVRPINRGAPATAQPVSAPRAMPTAEQGQRYSVVSGDSLWKIAARLREVGSTVSQQDLMNDIHALNPQAFINGDINRMRAGGELLLPDSVARTPAVADIDSSVAADAAVVSAPAEAVVVELLVGESPDAVADQQALLKEQSRVDQELANQIAETSQLQQSLAQLGVQVEALQEQMAARDRQIAGLQAELAARTAAAAVVPTAPVTAAAPDTSDNNWLTAGLALLALLFAGVVGVLWRSRNRSPEPQAPVEQVSVAVRPTAAVAPRAAAAVSVSAHTAPSTGPIWPEADKTDALQSANVYIAYGRFADAATTLRQALRVQPQRSDIGFRLLEVLAKLGDIQAFSELESNLRAAGFNAVRIDELKARHAELFSTPPTELLDDAELHLDDVSLEVSESSVPDDSNLNLDDLSLDADWDLVSPFSPAAPNKTQSAPSPVSAKASDSFEMGAGRDARSPFAESMLVEETTQDGWADEELSDAFADQPKAAPLTVISELDDLAGSRDNLAKLNMALAYIEQGSLDSACSILNEIISSGDEKQKQRARQLLARIA